MKTEYQAWINANVTLKTAFAGCAEITKAMRAAFPELKRIRGHVTLSTGLERSHWWLEDAQGGTVDPTACQFALPYFGGAAVAFYEPWDETREQPTGKCPNCGGYCYEGRDLCGPACEVAYAAYCNNPGCRLEF